RAQTVGHESVALRLVNFPPAESRRLPITPRTKTGPFSNANTTSHERRAVPPADRTDVVHGLSCVPRGPRRGVARALGSRRDQLLQGRPAGSEGQGLPAGARPREAQGVAVPLREGEALSSVGSSRARSRRARAGGASRSDQPVRGGRAPEGQ